MIRSYLDDSDKTENFKCPTAPDEAQWNVSYTNNLPAKTGYKAGETRLRPGGSFFMSYGYNVWGAFGHLRQGLGVYLNATDGRGERRPNEIFNPSEMIAIGDSNWDLTRNGDRNWSGFIGMYAERQWPLDLHGYKSNLLLVDGHTEALARPDFVGQLNTDEKSRMAAAALWNADGQPHFQ